MHTLLLVVALTAAPELPTDLAADAKAVDAAHLLFDQQGYRESSSDYIRSWLDQSKPRGVERLQRLRARTDGLWCFALEGLLTTIGAVHLAARNAPAVASTPGGKATLAGLEALERRLVQAHWGRCRGPGGNAANTEWDRIAHEIARELNGLRRERARMPCVPVPMSGITACAPSAEEVPQLTPGQALLVAAGIAIGLAGPEAWPAWPVLAQRLAAAGAL